MGDPTGCSHAGCHVGEVDYKRQVREMRWVSVMLRSRCEATAAGVKQTVFAVMCEACGVMWYDAMRSIVM